ncbi:MAG: hypothetical protein ABSA07_01830 [Acidimicrobiales bacterium]
MILGGGACGHRRWPLRRIEDTDIEVSDQAREFVAARGGTLFLRVRHNRCCSGGLTFLDATTSPPRDEDRYESLGASEPTVRLWHAGSVLPDKVNVEVRGILRPHLVAYWDGCAFRF